MGELDVVRESPAPDAPRETPALADLDEALADLAGRQQQALAALIAESRRCDDLRAALPAGAPLPRIDERQAEISAAILAILKGWHALGGTIRLGPPPGLAPLAPPEPLPGQAAAPAKPPAAAPAAPPARDEPAPARPPATGPLRPLPGATRPPRPPPAHASPPPPRDWAEDLGALLLSLRATTNALEEMEAIQRAANTSFQRWSRYPRTVQRALVGNLACRLRHLQDHLGVTGSRLDTAFRSLTRFSKSTQPGWVNGLTRGRGPAAESWAEEARCWWDQLVLSAERAVHGGAGAEPLATGPAREEALAAVQGWIDEWRQAPAVAKPMCMEKTLAAIQTAREAGVPVTDAELCRLAGDIYDHLELPRFRRLRQAIRDLEQAEREDAGGPVADALPADWPWWSHTVGRRALLFATDIEPGVVARIERAFGLAALSARDLDESFTDASEVGPALASAGAELVLVAGEDPDEPMLRAVIRACQVRGLPWIHVEHGIGVIRVRMAIERFLHPDPRGEPPAFDEAAPEPGAEE